MMCLKEKIYAGFLPVFFFFNLLPDSQYLKLSLFWKKYSNMILELYDFLVTQQKAESPLETLSFLGLDFYCTFVPKLEDTSTLLRELAINEQGRKVSNAT